MQVSPIVEPADFWYPHLELRRGGGGPTAKITVPMELVKRHGLAEGDLVEVILIGKYVSRPNLVLSEHGAHSGV